MVRASQKRGRADKAPPEVLKLTRRMTTLFRERLEEQLRPLGITAAQLQLLAALTKEPGTSGAHISRYCQVTPQTTHALLAVAEATRLGTALARIRRTRTRCWPP